MPRPVLPPKPAPVSPLVPAPPPKPTGLPPKTEGPPPPPPKPKGVLVQNKFLPNGIYLVKEPEIKLITDLSGTDLRRIPYHPTMPISNPYDPNAG
jgi:hypothetical protein